MLETVAPALMEHGLLGVLLLLALAGLAWAVRALLKAKDDHRAEVLDLAREQLVAQASSNQVLARIADKLEVR